MIEHLDIRVLVDNTVYRAGLGAEHGLSLFIRWNDHALLFDTGQSDLFVRNARALDVELSSLDLVVLSHGHYDHGGGLPAFLASHAGVPIVTHPGAVVARWSCKPGMAPRSIGLADSIRARRDLFQFCEQPTEIAEGCTFLGGIPRAHSEGCGVRDFFLDPEQRDPDGVLDDSGVVFDTTKGLVLITGCCHAGIANYLALVRSLWPSKNIRMVLGGLHLAAASHSEKHDAISALEGAGVESVAAMHCTGFRGAQALDAAGGFATIVLETGAMVGV